MHQFHNQTEIKGHCMMISRVTSQKLHEGLSSNHKDAKFWGPWCVRKRVIQFLLLQTKDWVIIADSTESGVNNCNIVEHWAKLGYYFWLNRARRMFCICKKNIVLLLNLAGTPRKEEPRECQYVLEIVTCRGLNSLLLHTSFLFLRNQSYFKEQTQYLFFCMQPSRSTNRVRLWGRPSM